MITLSNISDMKTCDECANYECDNFDGVGWCDLNKDMVLHDDPACKEFRVPANVDSR